MRLTRSTILFAFFLVASLFISGRALAFNEQINYQGKLTGTDDAPVPDGNYNLRFRFCTDSSCASPFWTETWCHGDICDAVTGNTTDLRIPVTNGLFNVMLGAHQPMPNDVWNNSAVYLEVAVAGTLDTPTTTDWEVLTPRKRMGAVPSAFEALRLGGKTESAFGTLSENESVTGAWSFNNILSVTANSASPALSILQSGAGAGLVVGNGSVTTSIFSNATSTFNYGANFASAGGAVTIGTNNTISSTDKLSVLGNVTITGDINLVGDSNLFINGFAAALPSASTTGQTLYFGLSGWQATDNIFIDSYGSVGIGTTTPGLNGALFEVNGSSIFDASSSFRGNANFIGATNFSSTSTFGGVSSFNNQTNFATNTNFSGVANFNNAVNISGKIFSPVQVGLLLNGDDGGDVAIGGNMVVSGDYAYIASTNSSTLEIVDISIPSSPIPVSRFDSAYQPSFLAVSGKFAFLTSFSSNLLEVVDITNHTSPIHVGEVAIPDPASTVVAGNYAYVSSYINDGVNGLDVVDISDPLNPHVVGRLDVPFASRIRVSGHFAFVLSYDGFGGSIRRLDVIDISDPQNPIKVGHVENGDQGGLVSLDAPVDLVISGNYAYITASDALEILNISDPTNPVHAGKISGSSYLSGPAAIFVAGKYAYIGAYGPNGQTIAVVDISDPTNPTWVSGIAGGDTGLFSAGTIYVGGNYLFGVGQTESTVDGLVAIDITGSNISNTEIGNARISNLSVLNAVDFGGNLSIKGGLDVGSSGLWLNGDLGMYGNVTNTLSFSTTTVFQTGVTGTASNAFIFNATNFSDSSTGYILSLRANNQERFRVSATGIVEASGIHTFGTSDLGGDVNISNSGALFLGGTNYSKFFVDATGTAGYVWQSDGDGAGQWVSTSSLGISSGGGGSLPSASPGQTLVFDGADWISTSVINLNGFANVGIGTDASLSYKLTVGGDLNVTGSLYINGNNASQYFIDSAGINGYIWQSDGSGAGQWIDPAALGGGSLPSGSAGQTFVNTGGSNWVATSSLFIDSNGHVGVGTESPEARLHVNGDSLFAATSTFNGALVTTNGLFNSGVSIGGGGGGENLLQNSSFTDQMSIGHDDHPWSSVTSSDMTSAFLIVTTTFGRTDSSSVILGSGDSLFGIAQGYSTSTNGANMNLSFYAATPSSTKVRVLLFGADCGGGGGGGGNNSAVYNFASSTWVCGIFTGAPSSALYIYDIDLSPSNFTQYTVPFVAPATSSIGVFILVGSSDGSYQDQMVAIDDVALTAEAGGGSSSTGFIFNATNFSSSSPSDTLLSIRAGGDERLNLTSAGNLSVLGDLDIGGAYKMNGSNVSQYFITSAGTAGQVWQSDGSGAGQWVSTSSLGISGGGGSLPDGTSGQVLVYGDSGWAASSTIQVSNLSASNSALFAGMIGIDSSGVINSLSSGESATSSNLLTNGSFESSPATTSWEDVSVGGGSIMPVSTGMGPPIYDGSQAIVLLSGTYETTIGMGGIMQSFSNPGATSSLSFYAAAQADWTQVGVFLVGNEECDTDSKYVYNIYDNAWQCIVVNPLNFQFDGSYVQNFALFSDGYHEQTMNIAPYTHSGNISIYFINGEEDGGDFGIYQGQTIVLDQVTLTTQEAAVPAFIFNTPNFSTSSDSATLLSIRSNGSERFNLTSGGVLSVGGLSSYGTSNFYGNSSMATTTFSATVGIGTAASTSAQLEILSTAYSQLRLSYSADAYATMGIGPAGNLIINPTNTSDSSVYTQDFNGSFPPGSWTSGGDATWFQNTSITQEGAGSAQSGDIDSSQTSWINLDIETSDGNVTFWRKVSSESGWDYLQFCYDMNETCGRTSGSITGISGFVDWEQVSFSVTAGMHSFRWLYAKDGSASAGADSGYIDNISIPTPGGETALIVNGGGKFSGHVLVGTTTAFTSSSDYMLQVDSGSSEGDGIAVNGQIIASSYITGSTTVDLAETYPVLAGCKLDNSCPESGDTVCSKLVSSTYYVEKCAENSRDKSLGVVTTKPGMVLGGIFKNSEDKDTVSVAVALVGRVPVKVNMASGTINPGDEITAADVSGFATKAMEPGRVLGVALTPFTGSVSAPTGTIEMFVNPHWSIGNINEADIPETLPDFQNNPTTTLDKFTLVIKNSLQKLGLVIKNGIATVGELFAQKIHTNELCVGNTCVSEDELKALLEKNQVAPVVQDNITPVFSPGGTVLIDENPTTTTAAPDNTVSSNSDNTSSENSPSENNTNTVLPNLDPAPAVDNSVTESPAPESSAPAVSEE